MGFKRRKITLKTREDAKKHLVKVDWKALEGRCFYRILPAVAKEYTAQELVASYEFPQEWAFQWAYYIGDKDLMRPLITESEWAYTWARYIGDKDLMRSLITEPEWAYMWARHIGDKDLMRSLITESEWAYMWALYLGDKDLMRPIVKGTRWESEWRYCIGEIWGSNEEK